MPQVTSKVVDPSAGRQVIYDKVSVSIQVGPHDALTEEMAKRFLGWEEDTEAVKFGSDYLLTDANGVKVRCTNNSANRPLTESWCYTFAQDILNRHWKLNGETIIIGRTGLVLSGQHRLIGLILANQLYRKENEHWKKVWTVPPVIDTIVVTGIDEAHETTMTLDNVKPRTLSDVLFVAGYFGKLDANDRKQVCKLTETAVKMLWSRTGAKNDPYSPHRTHSEAVEWIGNHPGLIKSVKHIFEENQKQTVNGKVGPAPIGQYFPAGYAAALHYLMAVSASDGEKYRSAETPSEKLLDKSLWDKADEFWVALATPGDKQFKPVRDKIASFNNPETGETGGTVAEKSAVLIKAWDQFVNGSPLTEKWLSIDDCYAKDETDGTVSWNSEAAPILGGIDLGELGAEEEEPEPEPAPAPKPSPGPVKKPVKGAPTKEEIEAAAAKAKAAVKATTAKNREKANGKPPEPTAPKPEPATEDAPKPTIESEPNPEPAPTPAAPTAPGPKKKPIAKKPKATTETANPEPVAANS